MLRPHSDIPGFIQVNDETVSDELTREDNDSLMDI